MEPKKKFVPISAKDREAARVVACDQLIERGWPEFIIQLPECYVVALCALDNLAEGQSKIQLGHTAFRAALLSVCDWWINDLAEVSLYNLCEIGLLKCIDPGTPYGIHGKPACAGVYELCKRDISKPKKVPAAKAMNQGFGIVTLMPTQQFPGDGYAHRKDPGWGQGLLHCPCGMKFNNRTKGRHMESTIAICPDCASWHSILWLSPSRANDICCEV